MYIAIAGNIGSGKSLLAELLSERLGWKAASLGDSDGQNPYIDDFYDDMQRWSLPLQIYFLGTRLRAMQALIGSGEHHIIDRTIYEDAVVFAQNLHNCGLMEKRDFDAYYDLHRQVVQGLQPPALLVYIRAGAQKLQENIKARGRSYESTIERGYLERLGELYEDWTFSYSESPILVVDLDQHDIVLDTDAREAVLQRIVGMIKQ